MQRSPAHGAAIVAPGAAMERSPATPGVATELPELQWSGHRRLPALQWNARRRLPAPRRSSRRCNGVVGGDYGRYNGAPSSEGEDVASATPGYATPAVVSHTSIQSIHRDATAASCATISSRGGGCRRRNRPSSRAAPCSHYVTAARLQQTPPSALAGSTCTY